MMGSIHRCLEVCYIEESVLRNFQTRACLLIRFGGGSKIGHVFQKNATYFPEGVEKLQYMFLAMRAAVCAHMLYMHA